MTLIGWQPKPHLDVAGASPETLARYTRSSPICLGDLAAGMAALHELPCASDVTRASFPCAILNPDSHD